MRTTLTAAAVAIGLCAGTAAFAKDPRTQYVRDFDGDGRADLVWQSPTAGTGTWLMNGAEIAGAGGVTAPAGGGGSVVMTGDFNGDGRTDLLWRSAGGDRYDVLLMNGTFPTANAIVSPENSGWEAVGTGDFDNDGKTDIVWKNRAGDFRVSFMNGMAVRDNLAILGARPELSVASIADVDGDGRSDILWSAADGSVWLSTFGVGNIVTMRQLLGAGTGWVVAFTGDFDGDGHADIVWRHPDGRQAVWYMNDPLHPSYGSLVDAGTGWTVKLVRDFDGDGLSDLLWVHQDGSVAVWLMQGATPKAFAVLVGAGSGWSVSAADDYDGDGKDDLLWRHASGAYAIWTMDGIRGRTYKTILNAGSDWNVGPAFEGCDRTQGGSFSIVGSTAATAASGTLGTFGTKLVHVQRTPGACGGAYTVNFDAAFTAAGTTITSLASVLAPLGSGSVAFADGEPGIKAVAVTTGPNAGNYRLTLRSATAASANAPPTTASGAYSLDIVGLGAGVASYFITAVNAQQFIFGTSEPTSWPPLKPGESIAASFVYQPTPFTPLTLSVAQVTNQTFGGGVDIEIALSSTPGRFPGTEAGADTLCSKRMGYPGTAQTVIYAFNQVPNAYCQLTPGQTYYINVRQVSRNYADGTTPSCTNTKGCALRVQPQNLN